MPNAAASRLCLEPYSETAVARTARQCLDELGRKPDLALVFATPDYGHHLEDFLELVQLHGHAPRIAGGSGIGIVGTGQEAEGVSGFSLLLLHLPKTKITTVPFTEAEADDFSPSDWRRKAGEAVDSDAWIFLGNPLRVAAEPWLNAWSEAVGHAPVLGGLLSGGRQEDEIFTLLDRGPVEAGVALGLKGGIKLHTVVSQGCRPIGEPHAITGVHENVVTSIGSLPAYERLNESFESLTPEDKSRAAGNLFAGLALNEYVDDFKTGDFVIRNLLGADASRGTVELAAYPRVGQTLQFQLRDRHSAHEDLAHLLQKYVRKRFRPIAALSFLCGGRGKGLFGASHHDAVCLREAFGPIPNAGFFCNGEVGPIGGHNFVHGYSAAIGLLR
jgi:small ligand-binding sensory domain FIST